MKRLLLLVLTFALVLSSLTALAVTPSKVVGRWYLNTIDGKGISGEFYVEFNRDKSILLSKDGTQLDTKGVTWVIDGDSIRFEENGNYLLDADYQNEKIHIGSSKLGIISGDSGYYDYELSREPVTYYTPGTVKADIEDDFYGQYAPYLLYSNGMYTAADETTNGIFGIGFAELTIKLAGSQEGIVYLTDYRDGVLKAEIGTEMYTIQKTADANVIVIAYNAQGQSAYMYLRRVGSDPTPSAESVTPAPAATPAPVVTIEPTPAVTITPTLPPMPEPTAAPAPAETPVPGKPSFPGMIRRTNAPAPAPASDIGPEAFYGTYVVYKDKLANGRVLDMSTYGLMATIDAEGVHAVVYGQKATVPYAYADGAMTADLSVVSSENSFARAILQDGEMVVTLSNASGQVAETLYLKKAD